MPKYNKNQYTLQQVYRFYRKRCKERGVDPVDYKTHKAILDLWGLKFVEYLKQGKDVKLHNGLASIRIRKTKCTSFIDAQASRNAGKVIKKSNVHSGFYLARVRWNRHYTVMNSRGWRFIPTRHLSRTISKVMKTPGGHRVFVKQAKVTPYRHKENSYKNHILEL